MNLPARLLVCLAFFMTSAVGRAELPPLSPARLEDLAGTIVTGTVSKIATSNNWLNWPHVDTTHTMQIKVVKVHKGTGVAAGETITAKAWHSKNRPSGWTGPSGNHGIPKEGETVKFYLQHKDGALSVLVPNGIQPGE